jgi:hypothetical protein
MNEPSKDFSFEIKVKPGCEPPSEEQLEKMRNRIAEIISKAIEEEPCE